jgi:iron complex outermembrane recepter protein
MLTFTQASGLTGTPVAKPTRLLGKNARALSLLLATLMGAPLQAADRSTQALADLSLEELMNMSVTSVSKKHEKLSDAAAAIFVLSNDDLRRSGTTSVADALRLVPGLQVAAIDSSDWAISARGFNSQFANKLLVMIDGRTVYSPLFSGVFWDAQQMLLDDLDRIEVIRGPGATVWGANAVNGVISILSKSARETQGDFLYGGGGSLHQWLGGGRHGGTTGDGNYYRVYVTDQRTRDFRYANGQPAGDNWRLTKGGFRVDHYTKDDGHLTWQGDAYTGDLANRTGDLHGGNLLGRWTNTRSERSSYEVQAFLDRSYRNDSLAKGSVDTGDLSFQHTSGLGERNDIIWGLGYRFTRTLLDRANSPALTIQDHNIPLHLFSAFAQDEIKIVPDQLTFTVGTKIEHNDFTGFEVQPSARVVFKPTEKQTAWAAVSRAVRTPSETEGKELITFALGAPEFIPGGGPFPYVPILVSNSTLRSEVLWAYELGYRVQPSRRVSLDGSVFYNDYRHLTGHVVTAVIPGAPFGTIVTAPANTLRSQSYGGEAVLTVSASDSWRLSASYSRLQLQVQEKSVIDTEAHDKNAPTHQAVVRSAHELGHHASLDVQLRYVDKIRDVPSYLTADVRLAWRPTTRVELSLAGENLLDNRHPEQASLIGAPTIEVPRSFHGKVTWRY